MRLLILFAVWGAMILPTLPLTTFASDALDETLTLRAQQRDARMMWWRDAHLGMFIHWGVYAIPAGVWKNENGRTSNGCAEWIMHTRQIPVAEYQTLAPQFNPVKYNAEAWVKTAKNAGMKYLVITAKHHDGFAMFKTAASPWNIIDATPYKKDPMTELVAAARKHGLKFGFYYSQNLDWTHAGGGGNKWDAAQKGDADKYVNEIVIPQLREILTNYGKIDILWFDIPGGIINVTRARRILAAVLAINPEIIINDRLGGGFTGDTQTPENYIPPRGLPGHDWEVCLTMNRSWGFASADHEWKSAGEMIRKLADIVSKGGNLLLNVGPTAEGEIPAPSVERLTAVGAWMQQNGEAIYGARASVLPQLPNWGRATTKILPDKSTRLYAIVFATPENGEIVLTGLKNAIKAVKYLGGEDEIKAENTEHGVKLCLPPTLLGKENFVIAVDLIGEPQIEKTIAPDANGTFTLLPRDAELSGDVQAIYPDLHGLNAKGEEHLQFNENAANRAQWKISVPTAGTYLLTLRVAAPQAGTIEIERRIYLSEKQTNKVLVLPCVVYGNEAKDAGKFTDHEIYAPLEFAAGESTLILSPLKIGEGENEKISPYQLGTITLKKVAAATPTTQNREPNSYNWQERHEQIVKHNRETQPEIIFLGDSITHHFAGEPAFHHPLAPEIFRALVGDKKTTNGGCGFDYIENLTWRVLNGAVDNLAANGKIVILAGTNNLEHQKATAAQCEANMQALLAAIREKSPTAKIFLLSLLPRKNPALTAPLLTTNRYYARLAEQTPNCEYLDVYTKMIDVDGGVKAEMLRDDVHPTAAGYAVLAEVLKPYLTK